MSPARRKSPTRRKSCRCFLALDPDGFADCELLPSTPRQGKALAECLQELLPAHLLVEVYLEPGKPFVSNEHVPAGKILVRHINDLKMPAAAATPLGRLKEVVAYLLLAESMKNVTIQYSFVPTFVATRNKNGIVNRLVFEYSSSDILPSVM